MHTNQVKVSFIIPTLNRATNLKESIDSVLNQTHENIELIIVDDSTVNDVQKLCEKYENKIKYYRRNSLGISSALNYGLERMTGDWYKIMSDDDILLPNCTECFVNYTKNSTAKIIYSDIEYIDENGLGLGIHKPEGLEDSKYFKKAYWLHQIVISLSLFIHKSCFKKIGYFEDGYETAFDVKWCNKALLLHDYKFHYISEVLYKFRLHKKQSSFLNAENHLRIVERIRNEIKKQMLKEKPQQWQKFEKFLYNENFQTKTKKRIKKFVPTIIRKKLFTKQDVKGDNSFECRICKHFERRTNIIYVNKDQENIRCPKCRTYYNKNTIIRLTNL